MKISQKMLGFSTLFLLALILSFAPVDKMVVPVFTEEELVHQLNNRSNYIDADQLAHMIIDKEPGFQVLDIRSQEDFEKYHIPGALSIPLNKLFDKSSKDFILPYKMKILVSNGNTKAGQAWVLMRSKGYKDVFVLHGGMNYWVDTFNSPEKPDATAANDEFFVYQFRKAAGPVMMGNETAIENNDVDISKPKPVIRRRTAKKKLDEGC